MECEGKDIRPHCSHLPSHGGDAKHRGGIKYIKYILWIKVG